MQIDFSFLNSLPYLLAEQNLKRRLLLFTEKIAEMITIIKFKRCVADIIIFSMVICKLRYGYEFFLIVLLPIDKSMQISSYYTFLSLGLIVRQRIKYNEKL